MQQLVGSDPFLVATHPRRDASLLRLTPVATQAFVVISLRRCSKSSLQSYFSSVTQAFGVISLRQDNIPPAANFPVLTEASFQGLAPQFPPPVLTETPFQGLALHFPSPVLTEAPF